MFTLKYIKYRQKQLSSVLIKSQFSNKVHRP